ncbi:MAG: hypothetical protein WCK21_04935 [Actinomycetota bacterium]
MTLISAPHLDEADLIWQQCLFAFEDPSDDTSWVDVVPGWLRGADLVCAELVARLPWEQREVVVYQRRLPEPRLTAWWSPAEGTPEPLAVLEQARIALTGQYARPFDSVGFNLYRNGHDSLAWHADRERSSAGWVGAAAPDQPGRYSG